MAQIIANKIPIDLNARKAVGFGFPLNGNAVFVPTYQTKNQIQANLINYLLTNKNERVFNPSFGADLRSLVFKNPTATSLDELQFEIENALIILFPEIEVKEINFEDQGNENSITFSLTYNIITLGIEDSINIVLQ